MLTKKNAKQLLHTATIFLSPLDILEELGIIFSEHTNTYHNISEQQFTDFNAIYNKMLDELVEKTKD